MCAGLWAPAGEVHGVLATPSATAGMRGDDPRVPAAT